jgi:hypothetical protein
MTDDFEQQLADLLILAIIQTLRSAATMTPGAFESRIITLTKLLKKLRA